MKTLITFLFLCIGVCANLQAQDIFKSSVFIIERQTGQIQIDEKAKQITLQQVEDVKTGELSERKVQLEILEIIKEGKAKRFIVNDPKTDKVGLIYCFDIQKDGLRMYLLQHAKSVEFAKSLEIPENFGIQTYSWEVAKKISSQKNPEEMTKEDALKIMKIFKNGLEEILDEDIPEYRDYDEQMYLTHMYHSILAKHGYNIFSGEKSLTVGINQHFSDPEVKKLRDEIELLIEGKESDMEEAVEEDNN